MTIICCVRLIPHHKIWGFCNMALPTWTCIQKERYIYKALHSCRCLWLSTTIYNIGYLFSRFHSSHFFCFLFTTFHFTSFQVKNDFDLTCELFIIEFLTLTQPTLQFFLYACTVQMYLFHTGFVPVSYELKKEWWPGFGCVCLCLKVKQKQSKQL